MPSTLLHHSITGAVRGWECSQSRQCSGEEKVQSTSQPSQGHEWKWKTHSHQHSHLWIIWREWSQETVTYFLHFYWISRCQRVYCKMKPFKTRSTNNINYFLFRAIIKINFTLPLSLSPLPPLCVSLPPESISFSFHTLSDCHSLTV